MKKAPQYSSKVSEKARNERIQAASYLKPGDREEIARICGYTRQAISVFIHGYSDNPLIKKVFNRFVEERKKQIDEDLLNALNP